MNRALIFCIAIFFAVVGIALLGADNAAVAGHGCCGCHGGCGGYDCCGQSACGCCGYEAPAPACGCCGNGGGYGNGHAPSDAPGAEPAPPSAPAPAAYRRAPAGFRVVSFRR